MSVSAMLMSTAAKSRALSTMSRPRSAAWFRSARLYWTAGLPAKNNAIAVCSAVRTVEPADPVALTSLKSRA
jgi:hypothetical protein